METRCSSEYDESPDVSVEDEEEDEGEPQERQPLSNSLKNLNQDSGRAKTMSPDTMDAVQNEDSGLTWETSSSRCSTSQASETSATSGVYSMDNSYVDSPPGRAMDEGRTEQKTNSLLDQMSSFPNQNTGTGSKREAFSVRHTQGAAETRELDPADPHSWPYQVQPSKIKDYLIQITQEVESPVPEEKDNALKKKGELPLKGTVRARIEQITAVLEERNKRIFRRVNGKDLPSGGTRKPNEQPKIFSRQGVSVSLRHIERDTRDKNNKKEIIRYNLKPVQTNISKAAVSASYKKDERETRKYVLPETLNKASEKPSPILSPLADKANKLDHVSYSPVTQTPVSEPSRFVPPDDQDEVEKKAKQKSLPEEANVTSEKSSNLVDGTGKQTTEEHLPVATEVPPVSEAPRSTPEKKTAQPCSPVSAGPPPYFANEEENQTEPTAVVLSESAAREVQYPNIIKSEAVQHEHEHTLLAESASQDVELRLSKLESKDLALLHSAEETGKQIIPPYSPAESLPEETEASHSVMETGKQKMRQSEVEYLKKEDAQKQAPTMLREKLDHLPVLPSVEVSETREAETVPDLSSTDHRTEIQERPSAKEHFGLPQLSQLMGDAEKEGKDQLGLNLEKQGFQAQAPVTALLKPEFQEVSYSRDKAENQTEQLEFQHPLDSSLSIPTAQREEVHQHSVAIAESESEQPIISEPIKSQQGSGHTEPSHLRDTEVSSHSPTEILKQTSEQLPSISSVPTDNVEKQGTQPSSLAIAVPQSEKPNSILPSTAEQMGKQDNLLCSPDKAILVSKIPLPTVAVQTAEVIKLEIQPDSTTKAPSEELASISRASAVTEKKTIHPDLPLSTGPPPEASVRLQEGEELGNHAPPSTKATLYPEVQDASYLIGDDGQEGAHHLFATTQLEMKHSVAPETKEPYINDSTQSQLERKPTVALSSADEAGNKIMNQSITEASHPESLFLVHVPEKRERVQMETEQTPQVLPSTSLQKEESYVSPSVEEMAINDAQLHSPATAKELAESVCSTEAQDNADFSTGLTAADTRFSNTQNSVAEVTTCDIAASVSEHVAKQPIQSAVAELEPTCIQVLPSTSESRKHFDASFPVLSDEERDRFVTPQSDYAHLILTEAEGKETVHYSPTAPTSSAAPEPQGIQSHPSNEASKQSPVISSFSLGDTESLESSVPGPEQSNFLLTDYNDKPQKKENQCLSPKKPESVPEEPLSVTAFLMGEIKEELLHSSRAVKILPKESKSVPEDVTSEAVKETAPSFSPVSEEHLPNKTFSPFVVDTGEKQAWSSSLLTEESKQLTAEKTGIQDVPSHLRATAPSERRNEATELHCPVTAQSEAEDRMLISTTEGISKQEMPQYLLSTVQSALAHQELLYPTEERDNQERTPLQTEYSESLQSPDLQQEPEEHVDLLQAIKELAMEAIQPYSSAAVQGLSQPSGEKETVELRGHLPETAEVDFGVSMSTESMDEAEQKEIQPPRSEAEKLKYKQSASSLLTEIVEKQEVCCQSPEDPVSAMLLGQSNSALTDFNEKTEVQPSLPETVVSEEPFSIAAFLLSEAREMQTSFPKTAEKETLDTQRPFKEPSSLVEGSRSGSSLPPETDVAITREIQPSPTPLGRERLSQELHTEVADQDNRENICNIPTIPNLILNESSDTVLSEPVNVTQPWSVDSDKTTNKAIVISTGNVSEMQDIKNLPHSDMTWKQPENYLQKEKELKDNEKPREKAKRERATPELDQEKDTSSNSGDHETVNVHVPTLVSSVDKEGEMKLPEKLKYLEPVSSLKTQPFHLVENLVVGQKTSMCKPGAKTSDNLKIANLENKENELKEVVRETDVQGSVNNEKEILSVPENKNDVNVTSLDSLGKHTLTGDSSFMQTGKDRSDQGEQRPLDVTKESAEETTTPAASLENVSEFSLLESKLDGTFNGMARNGNATTTHKAISKALNEAKLVDSVRKSDKNIEEERNLVGAPLFNTENGMFPQTPLIPLPDQTVNPELLAGQPVWAFWKRDLHERAETESKEDSCKHPSDENIKNTEVPLHGKHGAPEDEVATYFEREIPEDGSPNDLEDSQRGGQKDQHVKEGPSIWQGTYESNEKECESVYIPSEATAQAKALLPREIVNDAPIEGPVEIASDVEVVTCQLIHAIPFGSRLYLSGAASDESSQNRVEESSSSETSQILPEETSDEESSPILDYAATVYQEESSVQDESEDITGLAAGQTQQSEIAGGEEVYNDVVRNLAEEGAQFPETSHHVSPQWQSERQVEKHLVPVPEPVAQGTCALDHEHLPSWDFEGQAYKNRAGENIASDLAIHSREGTNQQLSTSEAKSDKAFGELDFSLLSHDFESYPLYSIKEEEYSDDEDLAELLGYETVTQDDVFQEERASEVAHEELLFDDRKSLDRISDSYEFVNEKEASAYAEEEELMGLEKLPKKAPESEVLQRETELAQLDSYCCKCKCPISADDKLWGDHKDHSVTNLDTGVTELKGQLDGFLDVLQERSLKIEGFVSEIEALFNTLEENCKGKEQLLEEQNENIVKTVLGHHDQKAQSFEEIKNTKMEYLYEQMVNFQEYIDTAKETLETIIKETEEMDDFVFLRSDAGCKIRISVASGGCHALLVDYGWSGGTQCTGLWERLLSAAEHIRTLEKMPAAFSHFEHFAGNSASGNWTLEHMPVPQTPRLQPQEPNSATSTSVAVYWTVSEDDVIDFFQVYCMEEHPGRQEQSGLVEEYRVTVKESNCTLEDLEPGHCYSVWIMAVNYTGCSFPSEKSTFRTAPPTPVIKAEDCTVCWDTATIRWSTGNSEATDSFTLEYCRQYSPEGEGLRSLAGIQRPELKVNLEPNINYFFYVRAVNVFGMSEQSEAALISTKGTRFHIMKETAHPALQVSPNGNTLCLPKETQITGTSPVWGELLSSRGRHYWEVTVTGCEIYKIGICYSTTPPDSNLGQNSSSWCLYCPSKTSFIYKVLHNGEMSDVIVTERPARVGILLDYNAGRLLFFNAERGQVLFAVRQKFAAAAHPAFGLEQPGILHLHTGMELPEFAKHS